MISVKVVNQVDQIEEFDCDERADGARKKNCARDKAIRPEPITQLSGSRKPAIDSLSNMGATMLNFIFEIPASGEIALGINPITSLKELPKRVDRELRLVRQGFHWARLLTHLHCVFHGKKVGGARNIPMNLFRVVGRAKC